MKPLFKERMQNLLTDKSDFKKFEEILQSYPPKFIRVNTLKITPSDLLKKLRERWQVKQPFKSNPEILIVESELGPGDLGNAIEHLLGLYYIQEVSSMLSPIALDAQPGEFILDMCASPGSKTTQIAAKMENKGTIIANDIKLDRVKILSANLQRCGVSNTIISKKDGIALCSKLAKAGYKFDKILLDAPCSGEGTLRTSPKTYRMWNPKVIKNFSRQQKKLIAFALKALKKDGTLVYSTCTHAPEENEEIVNFALENFPVKIEKFNLPIECRPGIESWQDKQFNEEIKHTCRIYPQDNNTEGFFIAKMTLLEDVK